jgi:beta-glucosidase
MSLSWPRILPGGVGNINEKGIMFYDKLIDELLSNNIQPYITLFHWDFPYELYRCGGWLNPKSSDWFAEYTRVVVERFSDRVENWITLNEPQCFIGSGHMAGTHAPGDRLGLSQVLQAGHNALLAHGKAVQVIRAMAKLKPSIGCAFVGVVKTPYNEDNRLDIEAARKEMFSIKDKNCWNNTWWMDPVFCGNYPEDGLELFGSNVPKFTDAEMRIISNPIDFCGCNIYNGREIMADKDGQNVEAPRSPGYWTTAFNWAINPQSLYWGPRFFYERYKKPISISENGMANIDWVALDGKVHDPQRIDFLNRYLLQMRRAINDGVDIRQYFHWSLTDNFEWAEGFRIRCGLVFVDYQNQQRILKDSAYWYKDLIRTNGESLGKSVPDYHFNGKETIIKNMHYISAASKFLTKSEVNEPFV